MPRPGGEVCGGVPRGEGRRRSRRAQSSLPRRNRGPDRQPRRRSRVSRGGQGAAAASWGGSGTVGSHALAPIRDPVPLRSAMPWRQTTARTTCMGARKASTKRSGGASPASAATALPARPSRCTRPTATRATPAQWTCVAVSGQRVVLCICPMGRVSCCHTPCPPLCEPRSGHRHVHARGPHTEYRPPRGVGSGACTCQVPPLLLAANAAGCAGDHTAGADVARVLEPGRKLWRQRWRPRACEETQMPVSAPTSF